VDDLLRLCDQEVRINMELLNYDTGGTRWRSWLSRKVADSIPDGVIGIFH
jgi:hypothetical protein